ncbi:hypothetical protein D3C72_1592960 [compost metagenome]
MQRRRQRNPSHAPHADIGNHQIRHIHLTGTPKPGKRRLAIVGFPNDPQPRLQRQMHAHSVAHQRMVVDQ